MTLLESWLVVSKGNYPNPYFRLVKYYDLPRFFQNGDVAPMFLCNFHPIVDLLPPILL